MALDHQVVDRMRVYALQLLSINTGALSPAEAKNQRKFKLCEALSALANMVGPGNDPLTPNKEGILTLRKTGADTCLEPFGEKLAYYLSLTPDSIHPHLNNQRIRASSTEFMTDLDCISGLVQAIANRKHH